MPAGQRHCEWIGSVGRCSVGAVAEVRLGIGRCLADRIARDVTAGILPISTDAAALSDLILAIVQGMSVLARDNVPRERLLALAKQAMSAWPGSTSRLTTSDTASGPTRPDP